MLRDVARQWPLLGDARADGWQILSSLIYTGCCYLAPGTLYSCLAEEENADTDGLTHTQNQR
jgi:hypothetical protein